VRDVGSNARLKRLNARVEPLHMTLKNRTVLVRRHKTQNATKKSKTDKQPFD